MALRVFAATFVRGRRRVEAGGPPLRDDLGRRQVPHEAHLRGLAEAAAHRAADLARHAERAGDLAASMPHRDDDRFALEAVREAQRELDGEALDPGAGDRRRRRRGEAERRGGCRIVAAEERPVGLERLASAEAA